ncbi:MAG: LacI family transcriptional regulator [Opitutus sp.]|nr:LacI family transcriptional regulator [Opitutus sp.]
MIIFGFHRQPPNFYASSTHHLMRARLIDVAARAGVAPNTASTILNNRPDSWASKETRERVLLAAKELNYRPNKAALGVRLGRFNTIGLVVPDLHNPFYPVLADYLDQAVSIHGYDLILEHSRNDLASEQHSFQSILDRQVDGVALIVSDPDLHRPFLAGLAASGPPAVALAAKPDVALPVDSVVSDFSKGFAQAIEHLVGLGHQRFAFLCALAKGQDDGKRPELFRSQLGARGIASENISFVRCEHHIASARDAFRDLLRQSKSKRPTALIALNDLSAIGAMRAAADEKLRVPRDLSIIGVDNIPLGEYLPVALTTISQPIKEMVARTAHLLIQRIEGKSAKRPSQTIFPTELLIRESTARVRAG